MKIKYSIFILIIFFTTTFSKCEKEVYDAVFKNKSFVECYINGEFVIKENYGYNGFFAEINKFIHEGENILIVKCFNADQPNSRWYTGSGIYRNVNMLIFEKEHILLNGIKIQTKSYLNKIINVLI